MRPLANLMTRQTNLSCLHASAASHSSLEISFWNKGRSDTSFSHSKFSKYLTWPFEKKKHSYIGMAPFPIGCRLSSPLVMKLRVPRA